MPDLQVFRGREHSEVAVPLQLLLQDGRLDIFDEVKGHKYFQIYSRGSDLVFQCGGFIGLIPVNENIAIDVAPRVPISNLDRMFEKVGAGHALVSIIKRQYAESVEGAYLLSLMADELVDAVEDIADQGRYKEYGQDQHSGPPRSGRILIKDTLRFRSKFPGTSAVVMSRFNRTANTLFNYCIKLAIERAIALLSSSTNKAEIQRVSRLNCAWLEFKDVWHPADVLSVAADTRIAMQKMGLLSKPYRHALSLATAILLGTGPSQRNLPPSFSLGSMIFDVSDVFERYARSCLIEFSAYPVLDGNLARPTGAKKPLFDASTHSLSVPISATPDIVITKPDRTEAIAVVDAKYKPYKGFPDRSDVNQVLAYAVTYGANKAALLYPSLTGSSGVERFGQVGRVELLGLRLDLAAENLREEEHFFATSVLSTVGVPTL